MAPWNRDVLAEVHEDCVTGWNHVEAKIFGHDSSGRDVFGVRFECQVLDQKSPIVYFATVSEWSCKTKLIGSDNLKAFPLKQPAPSVGWVGIGSCF